MYIQICIFFTAIFFLLQKIFLYLIEDMRNKKIESQYKRKCHYIKQSSHLVSLHYIEYDITTFPTLKYKNFNHFNKYQFKKFGMI